MRRLLFAVTLVLAIHSMATAQQSASDAPATKEDVQKYLQVMHTKEMAKQMMDAMSKPMHKMVHDQYIKDKDKLPPDFEERMTQALDEMMNGFDWDEIIEAMVPTYQKHFTKGDLNSLSAFYSSATGQKVLQEMPAIMSEQMEAMMPIMQRQLAGMGERLQQQMAEMSKAAPKTQGNKPSTRKN
jgi:uncharacterized protein